ncbi:MAG: hypothetical protein U0930_19525 [Pirellulales bacterium]
MSPHSEVTICGYRDEFWHLDMPLTEPSVEPLLNGLSITATLT